MPTIRFGPDYGNSLAGPIRSRRPFGTAGASSTAGAARTEARNKEYECETLGWSPRTRIQKFEDFIDDPQFDIEFPIFDNVAEANEIIVTDTKISRAETVISRHGVLNSARIIAEDALATSDTNYVTFAIANKLASGSGTTAMLAASDANTTKATGGSAMAAVTGRTFTVHGTAANLSVSRGDILLATATVAGTLANEVHTPRIRMTFNTTPIGLQSRSVATAGSPTFSLLTGTSGSNGVIRAALSATNEAQYAGYDEADVLQMPMNMGWQFEAYVRIPTAITTAQGAFIGVGTAFNSTLSSIAEYAWFKFNASMALTFEAKDGTTTTTGQTPATALTLTANQFYLYRIVAKPAQGRNAGFAEFWLDDKMMGRITIAAATSSMLLQPIIGVQKSTGTTTPSIDIDWYMASWDRF